MCNSKRWKQRLWKRDGFISFLFGWALVTIVFLVILLFQLLSFSTPSEIKQLRGQGTVRTYDFPYNKVFYVSLSVIDERGLAIIESNKGEGYIIATEDSDFYYNREDNRFIFHIRIFKKPYASGGYKQIYGPTFSEGTGITEKSGFTDPQ